MVLLRFQLLAGSRVALRALAPVAAGVVAASVMYGTPMVVIHLSRSLFFSSRVSIGCAVFAVSAGLAIAFSAAPRLTPGLNGWARHLPASGVAFRRAATAGLVVVQLPVLALVMAGGLAALFDQPSTTWPRLAAAMGVVFAMATTADGLVKRRPPWPWIRSLPWSAATRVSLDGALLVGLAIPVLGVAAAIDVGVVWVVAGAVPLIGLRGAAAIRQAPGRLSAASGQLLVEGAVIGVLVALLPWTSAVFLALTPIGVRHAAEVEKRREISRWHELHHLAAGDPMSWSDA